jgi:hypothetical protein
MIEWHCGDLFDPALPDLCRSVTAGCRAGCQREDGNRQAACQELSHHLFLSFAGVERLKRNAAALGPHPLSG